MSSSDFLRPSPHFEKTGLCPTGGPVSAPATLDELLSPSVPAPAASPADPDPLQPDGPVPGPTTLAELIALRDQQPSSEPDFPVVDFSCPSPPDPLDAPGSSLPGPPAEPAPASWSGLDDAGRSLAAAVSHDRHRSRYTEAGHRQFWLCPVCGGSLALASPRPVLGVLSAPDNAELHPLVHPACLVLLEDSGGVGAAWTALEPWSIKRRADAERALGACLGPHVSYVA